MTRIYIIAALALALAASIWWQDRTQKRLNQTRVELSQAQATIEVERAARAHEIKIAKEASDAYQAELNRIRTSPDLGPVRLCKRASVPQTTPSRAPSGSDAEAPRHVEVEDATDIGPALNDFVEDCEANAAQLDSLQSWILSR